MGIVHNLSAAARTPCAYEPTAREATALATFAKRKEAVRKAPYLKTEAVACGDSVQARLQPDHADRGVAYDLMMEAFAVTEFPLLEGLLKDLAGLARNGNAVDANSMNYAVSIARGIDPQDPTEALIASQMAAIHMSTMRFANLVATLSANSSNNSQLEAYERSMSRLARTFAAQVEALKRYRSKGEQRVIVRHVTVKDGGQAIVGNVSHGGGAEQENER